MLLSLSNTVLISSELLWRGVSIAITGMVIVACALVLICLFIMSLPRLLKKIATVWPETAESHGGTTHSDSLVLDDDDILAAIGFVLHHRLQAQDDSSSSSAQATRA